MMVTNFSLVSFYKTHAALALRSLGEAAERAGFEPAVQFYPDNTLAVCHFRPTQSPLHGMVTTLVANMLTD